MNLKERLAKVGIRSYSVLIHDQTREWLIKEFSKGADEYPVNVSRLMRNLVWQMKERIQKGEKPPLRELIRTYWYMYVKPTLSRSLSLAEGTDQYKQLSEQIVYMVRDLEILKYSEIGFRDENTANRRIGANANIILVSEKIGHSHFLSEISEKYQVSFISLGGQPSLLSCEYFVNEMKERHVNLQRSYYIFTIIDFDPSGSIINDAFISNMKFFGIKNIRVFELIHPDMLTQTEILNSRYRIPTRSMEAKNEEWLKSVKEKNYKNFKYLVEGDILYGLESEAISTKRINNYITENMTPLLGQSEDLLQIYELRKLIKALKDLILFKLEA